MTTALGSLFQISSEFVGGLHADQTQNITPVPADQLFSAVSGQLQALEITENSSRTTLEQKGGDGATCIACGIGTIGTPGFDTPELQRAHFKTDWHRYNVKRRLEKKHPVSEDAFQTLLDEEAEVSSISGSSSDESDSEEAGSSSAAPLGPASNSSGPQVIFSASDGKLVSTWRCLLMQDHVGSRASSQPSPGELLAELQRLRKECRLLVVLLLRGGHFAASVLQVKQQAQQRGQQQADAFDVVAHKTFHRYVVRAGAGGKQSSKDATGKYARSAGSRLRRYNEAALERDVHELLASWQQHLQAADLIFVHAPGSNSKVLFPEQGSPVQQADSRVRRIPFVLRRPTYAETKRAVKVLTTLYQPDLAALQEAASKQAEAAAAAAAQASKPGASSSKQQEPAAEQQQQQQSPGSKAKDEPPLHKAAKAGDADRVTRLLESGHDPTAQDARGRVPYLLAASKEVRDAFRRHAAQHPEQWDYKAAAVPSALTEEMEAAQEAKKAEKKARQRAAAKERKASQAEKKAASGISKEMAVEDEIARAAAEAAAIAARQQAARASGSKGAAGSKVGGGQQGSQRAGSRAGQQGAQQQRPLTAEEMARRREQMAAAAEARMKALQAASQQQKLY